MEPMLDLAFDEFDFVEIADSNGRREESESGSISYVLTSS